MSTKYYAVEYTCTKNTITGTPNALTGKRSTACVIAVFETKKDRSGWVALGGYTPGMKGELSRSVVTLAKVNQLLAGQTSAARKEYLESLGL